MNGGEDRRLRGLFGALRAAEQQAAPGFESFLDPAPRDPAGEGERAAGGRRQLVRRCVWTGAGAALLAAAVLLLPRLGQPRRSMSLEEAIAAAQAISSWTAPTGELQDWTAVAMPQGVPSLDYESLALPEIGGPAAVTTPPPAP
jgi:hypothetical protein